MKKGIILALSISILSGCATTGSSYVPIVDLKGKSQIAFNSDLSDCQLYAKRKMSTKNSAIAGLFAGFITAAILGTSKAGRGRVAIAGAAAGARDSNLNRQSVVRNCMSGRGYRILD